MQVSIGNRLINSYITMALHVPYPFYLGDLIPASFLCRVLQSRPSNSFLIFCVSLISQPCLKGPKRTASEVDWSSLKLAVSDDILATSPRPCRLVYSQTLETFFDKGYDTNSPRSTN